ncbi:zinc finger protein-domain-containing protein [Hypoxylon trugodes]|uniref:zinc finger protein-domain-containing protein n=1 Tax=Hypoxylon trugodes TaxID=326681 RepID=UPI00219A57C1|nr:zinc finger protein-domain-containing protein [Hypoxylon trugodes]KAI1385215.1 zinc finger protein-domain-containing protein [Hypoxylon trugodes]
MSGNSEILSPIDPDFKKETPPMGDLERRLSHALSIHSVVSTSSSSAEINTTPSFTKIGAGACGAIFAEAGKSLVAKLAKNPGLELWNDYKMHTLIYEKATPLGARIRIPRPYFFVPGDDAEYFEKHTTLVEAAEDICNLPTHVLVTERIVPLPQITRTLLIEKYCSPHLQPSALACAGNRDCLVRVYLGSSNGKSGRSFFSLRNFKLHLNQLAELDLDLDTITSRMAEALAIMHWAAKTDARDVEFVLGHSAQEIPISPKTHDEISNMEPNSFTGPSSRVHDDFFHRTTELWLLDFNQVWPVTMDQAGVDGMVDAFKANDPYYPRPLQEGQFARRLWNQFVENYLSVADSIMGEMKQLPRLFLEGIIEAERAKAQRNA